MVGRSGGGLEEEQGILWYSFMGFILGSSFRQASEGKAEATGFFLWGPGSFILDWKLLMVVGLLLLS